MNCKVCDKKLHVSAQLDICMNCRKEIQNKDRIKVTCKICSKEMLDLSSHIIRIHEMSVKDYKEKYNVDKVCYHSDERRRKNSESQKGSLRSEESNKKRSETLRKKHKLGLIDITSHRTNKWREERSKEKLNYYISPEGHKTKKLIKNAAIKQFQETDVWNKDLTKETHPSIMKMSKTLSKTMKENPELQFNYKIAQIRKDGRKFGGEERFEWCLKQAGFVENIDYKYNQPCKVYDPIERKSKRCFYPDFLFKGGYYVEIDGVCHFDKNGKRNEYDNIRDNILQLNGYVKLWRIKHEDLFIKKTLHTTINKMKYWKSVFDKHDWKTETKDINKIENYSILEVSHNVEVSK